MTGLGFRVYERIDLQLAHPDHEARAWWGVETCNSCGGTNNTKCTTNGSLSAEENLPKTPSLNLNLVLQSAGPSEEGLSLGLHLGVKTVVGVST